MERPEMHVVQGVCFQESASDLRKVAHRNFFQKWAPHFHTVFSDICATLKNKMGPHFGGYGGWFWAGRCVACVTATLKRHWCAFHVVQRHTHTFISIISDSHPKNMTHFLLGDIMWNVKIDLRMCITQTLVISLALLLERHDPQKRDARSQARSWLTWH